MCMLLSESWLPVSQTLSQLPDWSCPSCSLHWTPHFHLLLRLHPKFLFFLINIKMIKGRVPQLFFFHDRKINGPHLDYDLSGVKAKEQNIWTGLDILLLIFINLKLARIYVAFHFFLHLLASASRALGYRQEPPVLTLISSVLSHCFKVTFFFNIMMTHMLWFGHRVLYNLWCCCEGCKTFQKWGTARGSQLMGNTAWGLDSALNQAQALFVSWSTDMWTSKISRFLCHRQNLSHHAYHCHDELHSLNYESM